MNECAMRSKFAEPALQSLWSGNFVLFFFFFSMPDLDPVL